MDKLLKAFVWVAAGVNLKLLFIINLLNGYKSTRFNYTLAIIIITYLNTVLQRAR